MTYKIIPVILMLVAAGCSSIPKKNLTTAEGVIAAHFNLPEEEVVKIQKEGLDDRDTISLLIISQSSHLTEDQVLGMINSGKTIDEIAKEAGIEPDTLKKKTDRIEKQVSKY